PVKTQPCLAPFVRRDHMRFTGIFWYFPASKSTIGTESQKFRISKRRNLMPSNSGTSPRAICLTKQNHNAIAGVWHV
ncbi:MAG TPA: hypothetical protein PKZ32_08185, partial [Candidatus Melainabacteria bacterium]|nr:hypothetical protein [Candidatus Melainabacteria bacterium]